MATPWAGPGAAASTPGASPAGGWAAAAPATPSLGRLVRPSVQLLLWGRSDVGQLGLQQAAPAALAAPGFGRSIGGYEAGSAICTPTPAQAPLATKEVVEMAGGDFHAAFVTADSELYTAGCDDNGQLGRLPRRPGGGGTGPPGHVTALESYSVVAVGCGAAHTMALTDNGAVLSWGGNEFGQLGWGSEGPDQRHPRPVKGVDQRVVRLAVGSNHALLLSASGNVLAVGQGSYGALGLGSKALVNRPLPVPIAPLCLVGVVQVAAGDNHSAALTADGRVFTWGRGKYGQLGHGDWANRDSPEPVSALRGLRATQLACGGAQTFVIVSSPSTGAEQPSSAAPNGEARAGIGAGSSAGGDGGGGDGGGGAGGSGAGPGVLYSFGRGYWGATGLGSMDNVCRPSKVRGLGSESVVQVSAGSRHTLVLTASHAVFAFGNNDFGQLGSGGRSPPSAGGAEQGHASPRRLALLPPKPVLAVLAAGDSSMALVQESRPGESTAAGPQPGRRHGLHAAVPYIIPNLQHLAAAAAATARDPRVMREVVEAVGEVLSSPGYVLAAFAEPTATNRSNQPAAEGRAEEVGLQDGAGSAGLEVGAIQRPPSPPPHGLDVEAIQGCFGALLRLYNSEVVGAVAASCLKLLDSVEAAEAEAARAAGDAAAEPGASPSSTSPPRNGAGPGPGPAGAAPGSSPAGAALLRVLFVLFQCPLLAASHVGPGVGARLAQRLVFCAVRLPPEAQQTLCDWLASLPPELLGGRVVRPLQQHLTAVAEEAAAAMRRVAGGGEAPAVASSLRGVMLETGRVLAALHAANERVGRKLPYSEFYNPQLSTAVNLREEYLIWIQMGGGSRTSTHPPHGRPWQPPQPLVSICQLPCLLTPDAKSRVLQGEAHIQMETEITHSAREALMQGLHPASAVYLDVSIRRGPHLLADAAAQLGSRPRNQLKRPLRVAFVSNGMHEEGVDQGGVSREFFQLLVAELFQPQYGMFEWNEESRTFWFSAASAALEGSTAEFRLVGVLLGLAIYNGVILDVHFPQVVYKKLLGEAVGLADLAEAFPTLGRSLQAVLAMEPGQVEDVLCRNFEVEVEYFGAKRAVPLIPGGSATPVTGANVRLYVRRLVEWTLDESVEAQFRAFAQGFHQVCGGPALSLFQHEELELLVCGLPHLDFGALRANARYEGGYSAAHPTIVMFWQVLSELGMEQKRRFLAFATGCDRAPVAGLGALVLTIQRSGADSEWLPSAHTCFNALLLPDYSTRAKLKAKLLLAIENAQGFGLR